MITVIVPVYNIKDYLPRCVRSITAQTYSRLEIILVDDGSTDGTGQLCHRLAEEDGRIRVLHKENGGSSSARNLALAQAAGEYVGFVDSDDYIAPDMYELLMRGIREFGVSAAQVARDEIDEKGNPLPDICVPPKEATVLDDREFMEELLMHRGDCSFCTKLIRRDLFPAEAFPVGKLNEDFHLLVRMLPGMGKVASLPDQAYHVFYRIGSNSRKADKETFSRVYADCVENADMVAEIVKRDYPELEDTAFRFGVFQRLEYLLHIPISQMTRDNGTYRGIVAYLRRNWARAMGSRILTEKNKAYHTLFAIAPKRLRRLHAAWRRGIGYRAAGGGLS
nr:glycosyltransferase family 2 protein [uncultured Acetatifactor sp.]